MAKVFAVVNKKGNLILTNSQLPIFYNKTLAKDKAENFGAKVIIIDKVKLTKFINENKE